MLVFVGAALFACLLGAATGEGCCTPDQWQGVQASTSGYVYHHRPSVVQGLVYVVYDYTNKRSASFANYTSEGKTRRYRLVQRYVDDKEGKLYVVDLQSDKCYQKKLKRPFRKACVPDSAQKLGAFYMGAGDNKVDAVAYKAQVKTEHYKLDVSLSVTEQGCIPLGETVVGVARGVPLMETVGFVNIEPGIKDPSVFDIPKECEETFPALIMSGLEHDYNFLVV